MKAFIAILALLSVATADKWALFVSGNNGWWNYCITSTICRGFDILHEAGVPEDHIVYLGFTDVFDDKENPYPGEIYTHENPEGPGIDHAAECRPHIDYADKLVSAELFMAVLRGDKEETKKLTGREEVKVIESGPEDTVFVYYMDHGGIGMCEVGASDLKEKVLMETVDKMWENKQYKNLVFYFEACHSGSMFRTLKSKQNVYAMTGSDVEHSAWMSECPPHDNVNGKHLGTCLSAWYDNFWMDQVTDHGSDITLKDMFTHVHEETAKETDQNVSQFGDIDTMGDMTLNTFIGDFKPKTKNAVKKEGLVRYDNVPKHLAIWNAIRNEKNSINKLEQVIRSEANKEVSVMRLAREYYKDDVKANKSAETRPAKYDQDCVAELTMKLIGKCGYELPMHEEHITVLENICANGSKDIDFSNVC